MNSMEQIAEYILDTSKNIFQINEKYNSQTIIKDNVFLINGEDICVEKSDKKDSSYYFEHPEIDGVIIKKENESYCIKATIQYVNKEGEKRGFAKVRIDDFYGEIKINGQRTGSWEMHDFEDDDFMKNPDPELPLVLDSMKNSLCNIYDELSRNTKFDRDMYNPEWVKQIKKYNG